MVVFPVVFSRNVVMGKMGVEGACEENRMALEFRSVGVGAEKMWGMGEKEEEKQCEFCL